MRQPIEIPFAFRYEHQKLHEKHKGHEAMHSEMVLVLLITLIVAQIVLVEWKKRHYKSYSVGMRAANPFKLKLPIFK